MCRPPSPSVVFVEKHTSASNTQQQLEQPPPPPPCTDNAATTVTTIVLVTVTFIVGYGLGVSDTELRVTCFIGASGLCFFALILNWDHLREQHAPLFRWMSQKTSFSSMSLGRMMASHSSGAALSTLSRVTSVDAIKNISTNLLSSLDCSKTIRAAIQSITRKECFARLDYIERLSINDVSILFQYAADANLDVFDKERFLEDKTPTVRAVITAIDMAIKVSRGSLSEGTKILSTMDRSEGDIDALRFVAATRIYAEWRNLRMVPKGYQRYALGISLGYRDVLQNLEKIERGVHEYLRHHQHSSSKNNRQDPSTPIPSPTLLQLLQFEAKTHVHRRLPRLKEKSAASGLLWTKRQLHYQTVLINNTLEVPMFYASGEAAARAAYQTVYIDYHGWAVKQIFTRSFGGSPPLDKIWLTICPPKDLPRDNKYKTSSSSSKSHSKQDSMDYPPPVRSLSDIHSSTTMSQSERTEGRAIDYDDDENDQNEDNELLVALDQFGHEIVEKWEDMIRMFNCGKEEKRKRKENLILSSESHFDLNQMNRDMVESSLGKEDLSDMSSVMASSLTSGGGRSMAEPRVTSSKQHGRHEAIQKSKRDAEDFVRGVSPMIADLGVMIDRMNMNDPTKA